jgi:hypothetical protein
MEARLNARALAMQALLLALLAFFYVGDWVRYARASAADTAWLGALPSLPLAFVGTGVLALSAGLLAYGLAKGRAATWRGYRLGPIFGVVILFFDFAVLSSMRSPMRADERALWAVTALADGASQHASHRAVPDDRTLLASFLEDLGPVPFFVRGHRVPAWTLDMRSGCTGPATDAAGDGAGTLIYCLAPDRKRAWVTLVGLPLGETYGSPAVVSADEPWSQVVAVSEEPVGPPAPSPAVPELGTSPLDVWPAPTPDKEPDASR